MLNKLPQGLDGLIVSSPSNISYLVNFPSRDSYLLISKKHNIYFTDSRYTEEASYKLEKSIGLEKINGNSFELIAKGCLDLGLKRIGFEERHISFAAYTAIRKNLSKKAKLIRTVGLIEELRQLKKEKELSKIRKAVEVAAKAFKFIKTYIRPGIREIELVAELEKFIRYQGAFSSSFPIIAASGPHSSLPHHISGSRKLRQDEPVLIDMGVDCSGYKSDLTRVFFLGKINSLAQDIYDIVKEAQQRAIEGVRRGEKISKIDKLARQYITKKGYGAYFVHNTGHGIGLEVHEEPNISVKNKGVLKAGMV
ncbi:MAG: aminopeptidase P family protein, partial [Candidatus Omnitrophica bacterium]|nr:aminopeptidase P family protein [Candidatus Omnitrophota bacterium]